MLKDSAINFIFAIRGKNVPDWAFFGKRSYDNFRKWKGQASVLTVAPELNLPRNDNALRISSTIKRYSNTIF